MLTICVESPFRGGLENIRYAKACMRYVLDMGHAPFASHLLYTQVLDDARPEHRRQGIDAGLRLGDSCDERWFFMDRGMSSGMKEAVERANTLGQTIRYAQLPPGVEIDESEGM